MKKFIALILTLVLALSLFGCSGGNQPSQTGTPSTGTPSSSDPAQSGDDWYKTPEFTLVFSTGDAETNIMCTIWKAWAEKVKEVTKGRVEIEIHYNGELVATPMALTALQQNTVDVAFVIQGTDPSLKMDPLNEIVSSFSRVQRPSAVYTGLLADPAFAKQYEQYKVIALVSQWNGVLATSKKEIRTPADVKGLNIAVCSGLAANVVSAMGGNPVFCEPNSEYTSLEKGVVDGAWYLPWDSMLAQSWAEQLKYAVMMPNHNSTNGILMSLATWNSLPAEVQEQIDSLQDWLVEYFDKTFVERSIECMEICEKDYGITLTWLTDEEKAAFQEYKDAAVAAYTTEVGAENMMKLYAELCEKYSADEYRFVDFDWTGPVW